jgi:hypothetical protein
MSSLSDFAEKLELGYKTFIKAVKWLRQYGYLPEGNLFDGTLTLQDIIEAIQLFQKYAGLDENGKLGDKELRVMSTPRCPLPDIPHGAAAVSNKWGLDHLKYFAAEYDDMSYQEWLAVAEQCHKDMAEICGLTFERTTNRSNANLVYEVGSGRREGFDSAGGVLAWAYLPPSTNYRGQLLCKFDKAETWLPLNSSGRGVILRAVWNHELGHNLGLSHSSNSKDLLAPYYNPRVVVPQRGDITRLQRLYGPPKHDPIPDPDPDPIPDPGEDPIEISIKCQGIVKNNVVTGSKFVMDIDGFRIQKLG